MSRTPRSKKVQRREFYSLYPWQCRHAPDQSEIVAYVEASAKWETVSIISSTSGANAESVADYICNLINENQKNKNLLQDAMKALETCMEEASLTFSSEQAADSVVRRIKLKMV